MSGIEAATDVFLKTTNWRRAKNDSGKVYYFEKGTNVVQWEEPAVLVAFLAAQRDKADSSINSGNHGSSSSSNGGIRKRKAVDDDDDEDSGRGRLAASVPAATAAAAAAAAADEKEEEEEEEEVDQTKGGDDAYNANDNDYYQADSGGYGDFGLDAYGGGDHGDTYNHNYNNNLNLYSQSKMGNADSEGEDSYMNDEPQLNTAILPNQSDRAATDERQQQQQQQRVLELTAQLSTKDAALDPSAIPAAQEYYRLTSDGAGVMRQLVQGYRGAPQLVGVVGDWLTLASALRAAAPTASASASASLANSAASAAAVGNQAAAAAETAVVDTLYRTAKDQYNRAATDALLLSKGGVPAFLHDMLSDAFCRRLLIELYDQHGESPLLGWCVREISASGHYAEISAIIRESEYLDVFKHLLASILGRCALRAPASSISSSGSSGSSSSGSSITADFVRACGSSEYLYLYGTKLLVFLEARLLQHAADLRASLGGGEHSPPLLRALLRVRRTRQELEAAAVWNKGGGADGGRGGGGGGGEDAAAAASRVLDTSSLFTVKLGGMYVRRLGTADADPMSRAMYECLDALRLGAVSAQHAERLLRILLQLDPATANTATTATTTTAAVDVDSLQVTGLQLRQLPLSLAYIRHPQLLRLLATAVITRRAAAAAGAQSGQGSDPSAGVRQVGRFAMLLALATSGPDDHNHADNSDYDYDYSNEWEELRVVGWASAHGAGGTTGERRSTESSSSSSSSSSSDAHAKSVQALYSQLMEAAALTAQATAAAVQLSTLSAERSRRLVALAKDKAHPVLATTLLLWTHAILADKGLLEVYTSVHLLPICMQIAVAAASTHPQLLGLSYNSLRAVLAVPRRSTKGEASEDDYTVHDAHVDAWQGMIFLIGLGYVSPPLRLLRDTISAADVDASVVRHVIGLLVRSIDISPTAHTPISQEFAVELLDILKYPNVLKAVASDHFSKADAEALHDLHAALTCLQQTGSLSLTLTLQTAQKKTPAATATVTAASASRRATAVTANTGANAAGAVGDEDDEDLF